MRLGLGGGEKGSTQVCLIPQPPNHRVCLRDSFRAISQEKVCLEKLASRANKPVGRNYFPDIPRSSLGAYSCLESQSQPWNPPLLFPTIKDSLPKATTMAPKSAILGQTRREQLPQEIKKQQKQPSQSATSHASDIQEIFIKSPSCAKHTQRAWDPATETMDKDPCPPGACIQVWGDRQQNSKQPVRYQIRPQ